MGHYHLRVNQREPKAKFCVGGMEGGRNGIQKRVGSLGSREMPLGLALGQGLWGTGRDVAGVVIAGQHSSYASGRLGSHRTFSLEGQGF